MLHLHLMSVRILYSKDYNLKTYQNVNCLKVLYSRKLQFKRDDCFILQTMGVIFATDSSNKGLEGFILPRV